MRSRERGLTRLPPFVRLAHGGSAHEVAHHLHLGPGDIDHKLVRLINQVVTGSYWPNRDADHRRFGVATGDTIEAEDINLIANPTSNQLINPG
jgi:hypothetical protein